MQKWKIMLDFRHFAVKSMEFSLTQFSKIQLYLWSLYVVFQKFLGQYGYISSLRSGNHDVTTAIQRFQEFYGLPVSGKLDDPTVRLMKKPRCGVADPNGDGKRMRRYAIGGKWGKTHLTYFVQPGQDLPHVSI